MYQEESNRCSPQGQERKELFRGGYLVKRVSRMPHTNPRTTNMGESKQLLSMIIEDANNEEYFINPRNVIYVKRREKFWKILLSNGEVIMTKNAEGAMAIANKIKQL